MITFVGVMFKLNVPFGPQEHAIITEVKQQINQNWPDGSNLLVNLTWFGPQFDNTAWQELQQLIINKQQFDRVFWLCAVDPVCILPDQIADLEAALHSKQNYYLGVGFAGPHSFNTHAIVIDQEFPDYTVEQLQLRNPVYPFINYNRKPKPHRTQLAQRLHKLPGIVTLGQNTPSDPIFTIDDDPRSYTHNGKFKLVTDFGGVPYDLCSLGRLDIWQQHLLNIVSETEFLPWDTTFVTEKTWKPVVGLRPFVINGQTPIYKWLRDRGFRTFNHYWPHVDIEAASELTIHNRIVEVAEFVVAQTPAQLRDMYTAMLPDLLHNRQRFYEFAKEQQLKIGNLFL